MAFSPILEKNSQVSKRSDELSKVIQEILVTGGKLECEFSVSWYFYLLYF